MEANHVLGSLFTIADNFFKNIKQSRRYWKKTEQCLFLETFSELIEEGLPFNDAISFIQIIMPDKKECLREFESAARDNQSLAKAFSYVISSESKLGRIALAQEQSYITQTLRNISKELLEEDKRKQKLKKALVYPIFLIFSALGLLIGIRHFLLPQITMLLPKDQNSSQNLATIIWWIKRGPDFLLGLLVVSALLIYWFKRYSRPESNLKLAKNVLRFGFLARPIKLFYTYTFIQELANVLKQNASIMIALGQLQNEYMPVTTKLLAHSLEQQLLSGRDVIEIFNSETLFTNELGLVMKRGDETHQVAKKLELYAKDCFIEAEAKIQKAISYIQPLLLLFVGAVITSIYFILLAPVITMIDQLM